MTVVLASVAFWAPFTLALPGDDGKPELVEGRARFKRLKTSESRALSRRMRANNLVPEVREAIQARLDDPKANFRAKERQDIEADLAAEPISDAEFLRDMLVDWDLKDTRGEIIVYAPVMRDELCEDWDGLEGALVRAYLKAREAAANPKAVEKNSEGPSATTS